MKSAQGSLPRLISTPDDLARLAEVLHREKTLAVDTESNSLYAYFEQVCLVQFSTPQADYLVDPLALGDLSPLAGVFNDPGIEKIFHAAEYDLLCLKRDFGFEFANLFDTMAAGRILGRSEVGLGSMLEVEFGVQLDKRCQRANWGERPLPAHLLNYARQDTHYLIGLRQRLASELEERGLAALAEEDFARLSSMRFTSDGHIPQAERPVDCWRVSGSYDLEPQQAAVLSELCHYRDQVARQANRPLFKVINDRTLLAIAVEAPRSMQELGRIPGMSQGQIRRHGHALLQAVQHGLKAPPIRPPRSPRPDGPFLARLEALRTWRKQAAQSMGVPSDVVLPRDVMQALAESGPQNRAELDEMLDDFPWRREHFGAQILNALGQKV